MSAKLLSSKAMANGDTFNLWVIVKNNKTKLFKEKILEGTTYLFGSNGEPLIKEKQPFDSGKFLLNL